MKTIVILGIVSFFSALIYLLSQKFNSKLLTAGVIFAVFMAFGHFVPLSVSNEMLFDRLFANLTPATIFLFSLDLDPKNLFGNKIGCSCKMGAKRYWLIVILAFVASFLSQFVVLALGFEANLLSTGVAAFVIGALASFTPLKYVNGTAEIATTMLYLLSALGGIAVIDFL